MHVEVHVGVHVGVRVCGGGTCGSGGARVWRVRVGVGVEVHGGYVWVGCVWGCMCGRWFGIVAVYLFVTIDWLLTFHQFCK